MEDDKIKELFGGFRPELSSSRLFMARLQKNMEAVEILRRHNRALARRNRIAVGVAALSGFVIGVIMTLIMPLTGEWLSSFCLPLLSRMQIHSRAVDFDIISLILTAGASVITALSAYEITMARFTAAEESRS